MREMLLSFKPKVYEKIFSGEKIFEHRRNFPDEPVKAYMYVSKPVRAITGIIYLGKKHIITDWEKEFSHDNEAISRIIKYEESYRFAMEIVEFRETNEIGLDDLKKDLSFIAPQSYIYLDDKPELKKYIEDRIKESGKIVKHSFDNISSNMVCVN